MLIDGAPACFGCIKLYKPECSFCDYKFDCSEYAVALNIIKNELFTLGIEED